MKEIIAFLRQLQANNNREWFNAHKDEFLKHQARFHVLVEERGSIEGGATLSMRIASW